MTTAPRVRTVTLRGILRTAHFRVGTYLTLVVAASAVLQFVIR